MKKEHINFVVVFFFDENNVRRNTNERDFTILKFYKEITYYCDSSIFVETFIFHPLFKPFIIKIPLYILRNIAFFSVMTNKI